MIAVIAGESLAPGAAPLLAAIVLGIVLAAISRPPAAERPGEQGPTVL